MESSSGFSPRIQWSTVLFILSTTAVALYWPFYAAGHGVRGVEIALALAYFVAVAMSITVGYHRLITHRAFRCRPWLEALLLVVGSAAWQGSALEWATDHVRHHAYVDTARDPYNIKRGFFYAHMGWLFYRRSKALQPPAYLTSDRLVMAQHRLYIPMAVATSFLVPFAVAGMGGLLLAGIVRLVVGHHTTWFINSWAHIGSRRPYHPELSAADNWFLAFLTFGEGWHNYHHTFPSDYRNGVGLLAWDPSKWFIALAAAVGVASDLKRVGPVPRWRCRVNAAIEYGNDRRKKFLELCRTRRALERQIDRCEARLARLLSRLQGISMPLAAPLPELRERLAAVSQELKQSVSAVSQKKAERIHELGELVSAYRTLLERLISCELKLLQSPA